MMNKSEFKRILEQFFKKINDLSYILDKRVYNGSFLRNTTKHKPVINFVSSIIRYLGFDLSDFAYIVIGGADGSEAFNVIMTTPINHSIIVENEKELCDKARRTRNVISDLYPKKQVLILEGDAVANSTKVKSHLTRLYQEKKIRGVIVSFQSVLHELPYRSVKNYDHYKFILSIIQNLPNVFFYCKEPIGLREYSGEVQLKIPCIDLDDLYKFAVIVNEKLSFSSEIFKGFDFISLDGKLAGEVIKKLVYLAIDHSVDSLIYELGENHTAFGFEDFLENVVCKIFSPNSSRIEYINSENFRKSFLDLNVIIRSVSNKFPSGIIPKAFVVITAWRTEKLEFNPPSFFSYSPIFLT